jgi:hypothetical protein
MSQQEGHQQQRSAPRGPSQTLVSQRASPTPAAGSTCPFAAAKCPALVRPAPTFGRGMPAGPGNSPFVCTRKFNLGQEESSAARREIFGSPIVLKPSLPCCEHRRPASTRTDRDLVYPRSKSDRRSSRSMSRPPLWRGMREAPNLASV